MSRAVATRDESRARSGARRFRRLVAIAAASLLTWWVPRAPAQELQSGAGAVVTRALEGCATDLLLVNHVSGWQLAWPSILESQPVATAAERRAALDSWAEAPALLEADVASLRRGPDRETRAPRPVVMRVLEQIDGLLGTPVDASPLTSPARRADSTDYAARWRERVAVPLRRAIADYASFLRTEYLPHAPEASSLYAGTDGGDCYRRAIERWTSLELSATEVESRGRQRLDALKGAIAAEAGVAVTALPELLDRLRTGRPPDGFETREDVTDHVRRALRRGCQVARAAFTALPSIPLRVEAASGALESSLPAAFYQPAGPGDRNARLVVNTSRPATRRLMSEAIAFHEGIPGHHLLFGLMADGRIPDGRFNAGYVEGWAVYAEQLALELDLYGGQLDRIGALGKQLWAASRLVVEPGLHERGWSRERAIEFMLANTPLPRTEIELEVDRYLALPGQSLSYALGALELLEARRAARAELGDAFELRAFHDVVLSAGIRPLPVVTEEVRRWAEAGASVAERRPATEGCSVL